MTTQFDTFNNSRGWNKGKLYNVSQWQEYPDQYPEAGMATSSSDGSHWSNIITNHITGSGSGPSTGTDYHQIAEQEMFGMGKADIVTERINYGSGSGPSTGTDVHQLEQQKKFGMGSANDAIMMKLFVRDKLKHGDGEAFKKAWHYTKSAVKAVKPAIETIKEAIEIYEKLMKIKNRHT